MSETTSTGPERPVTGVTGGVDLEVEPPAEESRTEATRTAFVGKSPGRLALARLRRDRVAIVSFWVLVFFSAVGILAPLIELVYGYSPNTLGSQLLDDNGIPLGYLGGITFSSDNPSHHMHILGVEPGTGRDIFMQLVYGARTSLGIAISAVIIATVLGVLIGIVAAYFGGWIDSGINWFIDFMLAFPFLIFCLAAIPVINTNLADSTGYVSPFDRVVTITAIFGLFGWMGTARLVRGQVLSLREREYVEAARAAGAGTSHILFRQLLPNLWAPILITFSLAVPATITGEAALSFLNIGVIEPTPDFGRMINNSIPYVFSDATYMLIPGLAIFILVLAFNLFGDALRDSLDPKSTR